MPRLTSACSGRANGLSLILNRLCAPLMPGVRRLIPAMKLSKALLFASLIAFTAQQTQAQRHFFFEEPKPFKHPVKIPQAVLNVMRAEIEGRRGCQLTQSTNLGHWFIGSRIDVASNRQAFILRSHKDCLNGADNDWFWIVLKTSGGYRVVLFSGTISVSVRNSKSHGLRDIETNAATAAISFRDVYKFDGTAYKRTDCFEAMPVNAKLQRVPCRSQ